MTTKNDTIRDKQPSWRQRLIRLLFLMITVQEIKEMGCTLFGVVLLWVIVSNMVFAFRHPWATDTQRFLHLWDAMTFQEIKQPK